MTLREARQVLDDHRPTDLLTVQDAALVVRMHPGAIWRLIRQGKLRAYGRPRALRVSLADLLPVYDPNVGTRK
jgi:hypothetical protein